MARIAIPAFLLFALVALSASAARPGNVGIARRNLKEHGRALADWNATAGDYSHSEPVAPFGWWNSISALAWPPTGSPVGCGLRDFPALPNGYGTSRMLCGGYTKEFNPLWTWKLTKPNSPDPYAPEAMNIMTGEDVFLRIFNPMLTHCKVTGSKSQIRCSYTNTSATLFNVEMAEQPGVLGIPVNYTGHLLLLKSSESGMYCRIQGKGDSSYINCNTANLAEATRFAMPYSHYYGFRLQNMGTGAACGANFIPLSYPWVSEVNCSVPDWSFNFYTDLTITQQHPSTNAITSGANYSFSAFDDLYHYQTSYFSDSGADGVISLDNPPPERPIPGSVFFTLHKVDFNPLDGFPYIADEGSAINEGNVVVMSAADTGLYCGVNGGQMMCDQEGLPPAADAGYYYIAGSTY